MNYGYPKIRNKWQNGTSWLQLFELSDIFNIPEFIMNDKPILDFFFPLVAVCQFFVVRNT